MRTFDISSTEAQVSLEGKVEGKVNRTCHWGSASKESSLSTAMLHKAGRSCLLVYVNELTFQAINQKMQDPLCQWPNKARPFSQGA